MAAGNALVPMNARRQGGRMTLAMAIQVLTTIREIRASRGRLRRRRAEIEAETGKEIGRYSAQNIAQTGERMAQTRANIGGIQAQSIGNQYNARVNMLNSLLGRGGIADALIRTPGLFSGGTTASVPGGAAPVDSNIFARYTGR